MTRARAIFILQLTYCIPIILIGAPFALLWDILCGLWWAVKNFASDLRSAFAESWLQAVRSVNNFKRGIVRKWELTK